MKKLSVSDIETLEKENKLPKINKDALKKSVKQKLAQAGETVRK
ncbi:hypothetical protein [Chryseobacterium sp. R2A-55]|nr:hypothetical protein [Chryseobacterium sp. R2A-55]